MRYIFCFLFVLLVPIQNSIASQKPDFIVGSASKTVNAWLEKNKNYRIAYDSDCEDQEGLVEYRNGGNGWPKNENYHPFFTLGDFNGDGKSDLAIVVIDSSKKKFLLIFNSYAFQSAKPAVFLEIEGFLFYGPPRPEPHRLIIGKFGTEGEVLIAKGESYEYDLSEY